MYFTAHISNCCSLAKRKCYTFHKLIFTVRFQHTKLNTSAKSNLGRGPRRSAVAHVRRKVPLVTMVRPKFAPKVPLPVDRSQTPLPASSLDSSDLWCQRASGFWIRSAVFPQYTGQTDARTDAQTDRSFPGKFDDYRPLSYESDAA